MTTGDDADVLVWGAEAPADRTARESLEIYRSLGAVPMLSTAIAGEPSTIPA